jgi:hypothetical protein
MTFKVLQLTIAASSLGFAGQAFAVTWDQQAERLQLVSASLLDAVPLLAPAPSGFSVAAKSVVSALPKMNATVGGKTEQPPQPPVHAVPTAEVSLNRATGNVVSVSARAWGGYLPGAAAGATGMTASCEETIYGGALGGWLSLGYAGKIGAEVSRQSSHAIVTGGITETNAKDRFDVQTKLTTASLTYAPGILPGAWIQGQRVARDTRTVFEIPGDGTTFRLRDESSLGSADAGTQVAAGFDFKNNVSIAGAYLHVPERVSMPRFLLGYNLPLGKRQDGAL